MRNLKLNLLNQKLEKVRLELANPQMKDYHDFQEIKPAENAKVKTINLTKNEAIVSAKIDTWACIPT